MAVRLYCKVQVDINRAEIKSGHSFEGLFIMKVSLVTLDL